MNNGMSVLVEPGAGEGSGIRDEDYTSKGATLAADRGDLFARADLITQVRSLGANPEKFGDDLPRAKANQIWIAMCEPLSEPGSAARAAGAGIRAFSLELMPRITRAQSMDVLSSMASLSGYRAVLLAAAVSPRMFPMMITAAGTIPASKVFVVGAGVAGLQAIATAKRLGAVVEAYDVRPAVKEQVQSVGGRFLELPLETGDAQDKGGYAKAQDENFYKRQRDLMTKVIADADVVITTAAVPGKKAPILVTEEMVRGMKPGSIFVDLAAERGGNCELTVPGETVERHRVQILGPTNISSSLAKDASPLFAKNVATFLNHLVKKGELIIDLNDEITRETMLTNDGQVIHAALQPKSTN
jgi:NAD(P) transhydrogenase subunit alpha